MKGEGEHGPHSVQLSPDKKSLYVVAGNHTDLTGNGFISLAKKLDKRQSCFHLSKIQEVMQMTEWLRADGLLILIRKEKHGNW